ncbi:MAG: sigma-70 family RNA polymerase sigma factor, partial [Planctomycetales bacterium]|nr:sigma-70 family RNA polymerase sigma factor [Planctomycetales bacterium]
SDTFLGWLRGITKHKVVDFHRRGAKFPMVVGGSAFAELMSELPNQVNDQPGPDPLQETGLLYQRALELIQTEFQDTTWRAFWATSIDGRPVRDVALDLQISEMAVRQAKSRVLRRLRATFALPE